MNLAEYGQVKNLTYKEYCDYLTMKYGKVPYTYGSSKNRRPEEGLFIHHIREDIVPSLSNYKVRKASDPSYQYPENLVYCNYLEHLLLHILIGQETAGDKNLGLDGPFVFIVPALLNFFDKGYRNHKINPHYYDVIKDNKDVFNILFDRYNKLIGDVDFLIDHNETLYLQLEKTLDEKGKALVVLGTGLGKTTTALQYIKHCREKYGREVRALVISPNDLIKKGWEKYGSWVDSTTYQSFGNRYKDIDLSLYHLVILDEVHHIGYEEDGRGAQVWGRAIKYILNQNIKVMGLTATPDRTDGIDIVNLFNGNVCEGLSVEDAIEQEIIHPFSYVTAIYDTDRIIEEYKDCENAELVGQLNLAINNTPTVKEIFNKYMPKNNRKGIVFIQEIEDKPYVLDIFKDIYPDVEFRAIDSKMPATIVAENRKWFEKTSSGYLIAVNMISEGAHYKGVNTIIMFRRTNSYLVYTQQLGRIITLARDEDPHAIVFDLVNNVDNVEYNNRKIDRDRERQSVTRVIEAIRRRAEKSNQIIVADETRDIVRCIREIKENDNYFWTEEEDRILNMYYELEGRKIQKRLHSRSWLAIRGRALKLGLKLSVDAMVCKPWSNENTSILYEEYPLYGRNISKLINCGYTPEQISAKALREGLVYNNKMPWSLWTDEEDKQLELLYFQENGKISKIVASFSALYPQRTSASINARLKTLHLSNIDNMHRWSAHEDNIIKKYYPIEGTKCMERLNGISRDAIKTRARLLNVHLEEKGKKVICLEKNIIYISASDAMRVLNIKGVDNVCRGKCRTAGGYHWAYLDDFKKSNLSSEMYIQKIESKRGPKRKKVLCVDTGIVYRNARQAIQQTSISSINACLNNVCHTAGGYHWKYIDENEDKTTEKE